MEKDISKKEIIKFLYRCKKSYKLFSEEFKPVFKEYLMTNDIGYFAISSALNLALEKKRISNKEYKCLITIIDTYDEDFKLKYAYSWNCDEFISLMKDHHYTDDEILVMIKNLYLSGKIKLNDIEKYVYDTNQKYD